MILKDVLEQEALLNSKTVYIKNFDCWAIYFPTFDKAWIEMEDGKKLWVHCDDQWDIERQLEMRLFWNEYEIDQAEGE